MYLFMIIIHVLFPETFSLDYLLVFITNDGPFCFARVPIRKSRAPLPPFGLEGTRLGTTMKVLHPSIKVKYYFVQTFLLFSFPNFDHLISIE
jgi:hypothetical protein